MRPAVVVIAKFFRLPLTAYLNYGQKPAKCGQDSGQVRSPQNQYPSNKTTFLPSNLFGKVQQKNEDRLTRIAKGKPEAKRKRCGIAKLAVSRGKLAIQLPLQEKKFAMSKTT
ncbi:MAG: hypothetical protein IT427_14270 [Pirellulales bacterium]|nr:hypothetical protein [Pirellulales bacterium]